MEKISKSLEVLKVLSNTIPEQSTTNNDRSRTDSLSINKDKIYHLNNITDLLCSPSVIKNNNENYCKILTTSVETLFAHCDENEQDVRLAAEESINKLVKSLKDVHLGRIQVELHRVIKRNPNVGPRALRGSLWRFAELVHLLHPKKIRPYLEHLLAAFCSIATRSEEGLHEKLADYYDMIFRILGRSINDKEMKDLLLAYLANMSNESALIRRSSAGCLTVICRHSRHPMIVARFLMTYAIDQLLDHYQRTDSLRLINGYLGLMKNLIQLLGANINEFSLSSSNNIQQILNTNRTNDSNEQTHPINIRHIIECVDMICYLCLHHTDHNVISSSLEALEPILKYSNLFDFDHLLISTDYSAIEETRISQALRTAYPQYQRSFIDINDQQQTAISQIHEEIESTSIIHNEKPTSAAKLVQQLVSKYLLKTDGKIKTEEESRVSIKNATLICLSYLATIDPFAFFDSFDYSAEIITNLLLLREHNDPQLRSACSNLLAKLIETTARLLTISPQIPSLSGSITQQFSLVSIDSQDSSRLDMQLGILAELLSTFRSFLNDPQPRVVYVSLNALRTLLPVLLINNQPITKVALELLGNALQYSTISYSLAKVALAQLIGDIDFRILAYLENQQCTKKTNRSWLVRCIDIILKFLADEDSRVRQAAANTFAKFSKQTSFLPSSWPIHYLLKWVNSSCEWIYTVHHPLQHTTIRTNEIQQETISHLSTLIFDRLAQASTRIQIIGCFEGILALANCLTSSTVQSFFHNQYDELHLLIHFLKHPVVLHDLNNLQLLLDIVNVLFSKLSIMSNELINPQQSSEKVFHFLIKILSIFACVIEDTSPPVPATSKINFPPLPGSPQQLKKRFETSIDSKNEKDFNEIDGANTTNSSRDASITLNSTNSDKDKKLTRTQLGAVGNNPSMMKLFELIRASYQIHKSALNSNDIDRFGQLLSTILLTIKSVLNLVSIQDISKHLEEALSYLKSTFNIDKIKTIQCTQEFLQNLHQLTMSSTVLNETQSLNNPSSNLSSNDYLTNIHKLTIRQPMLYLFPSRHSSNANHDQTAGNDVIREIYLTKTQRKTIEYLKHPPNRADRTKIGGYIRLFEPIVILSLKKYVNSNETEFQASVLNLLVQLLLLRVNYSLLDADEHFLMHVTSQLESLEEPTTGYDVSSNFIYRIAEFLIMLSHESLNSKQVKVQDLIKHCDSLLASERDPEIYALTALEPIVYDLFLIRVKTDNKELEAQRMVIVQILVKLVRYNKALKLLTIIVDSVRNEAEKWKRLSRQIIDVLLAHIQSSNSFILAKNQSLLDVYSTQLTLFNVVSLVALRPIDPFVVAFCILANQHDQDHRTINRWLMNINVLFRCIILNSTEDTIVGRWKDAISSTIGVRSESFSSALLRILYNTTSHVLTNIRKSRGEIDITLISLLSDYLYLLIYIVENAKIFRTIVNDLRQLLIHDDIDETVQEIDPFSYLTTLSEYFQLLAPFYIPLLFQWTHLFNILDYLQESWWSSMLSIPTPSSLITHLSITGQLQSYCDLICRQELYVEHLTSIITHRHLLSILFEQSDTCTYVHNLFGLIHRTAAASHLYVESIYTNWDYLLQRNKLLLSLKILRTLDGIHLEENGLLLVLLVEQFLALPYSSVSRSAELTVCRRIEMMLTLDDEEIKHQLMPKYLPLILNVLLPSKIQNKHDIKSNEHLWALVERLVERVNYNSSIPVDNTTKDFKNLKHTDEDFILNWVRTVNCPIDITPSMYAEMLKNVPYKKLLPFMISPDFVWLSMPYCLRLGLDIPSLWRASTSALIKKINDLCFGLPSQKLISNETNLNDDETSIDSIYIKGIISCSKSQDYLTALINSIFTYFDIVQIHENLAYQFSPGDVNDLLRFIVYVSEIIYINISLKHLFFTWDFIESFLQCLNKAIYFPKSIIYQLLSGIDQIISSCTLLKTITAIYEYIYQLNGLNMSTKQTNQNSNAYLNLIEPDTVHRSTQHLYAAFNDLDRIYKLTKTINTIPYFYRSHLRIASILICRLPIFNSFIRIPTQFWEQSGHNCNKLQFDVNNCCLSTFPIELLQHSDIMADYVERISFVGWLSRTQFQEIWVTFLSAVNSQSLPHVDDEQMNNRTNDELLETNAMLCVWVRGVTTFLLNALRLNCTGNPADDEFEQRGRNKSISFLLTPMGGQYIRTRSRVETNSKSLFTNIERLGTEDLLSYGQLSYDTILTSIQSNNTSPLPANSLFDRLFSGHQLDLTSPLQILIEQYVRWLTAKPNTLCLQLKYELIRSFIYLSDLFTSSQHLTNLYYLCDEYNRTWLEDDDLIMSLVSYGLCKCGVLLGQTTKDCNELYIRSIERSFKSFSRLTAFASCLFILESHEDDLNKLLMTILNSEINNELQNNNLKINLDVRLNGFMLANLFYLIENDSTNSNELLTLICKENTLDINDNLTQQYLSIGLERLLLLGQYPKNEIWRLYKRSITTLRQPIWLNTNHLILILVRLYTLLNISNKENLHHEQEMIDGTSPISSLENTLIELVGELYERTKQSYTLPYEAILLLRPLPSLLTHIGLSDHSMNKILLEFATSTQQLYPQILGYTVFTVFRTLLKSNYASKVNEWTLLSMSGVAQRKPTRTAVWGLTCLMLSACPIHTIADGLFPLALSRFNVPPKELDKHLFLLAGREYYHQLNNVEQQHQFEQAFSHESNIDDLYNELLTHLRDTITPSS